MGWADYCSDLIDFLFNSEWMKKKDEDVRRLRRRKGKKRMRFLLASGALQMRMCYYARKELTEASRSKFSIGTDFEKNE